MAQHTTIYKLDSEGVLGRVKAGEAITMNDLVYNDEITSKVFKVRCTDSAVINNVTYGTAQTNASTGQIFTSSALGQKFPAGQITRNPVVVTANNQQIATLSGSAGGATGIRINRFRSDGTSINTIEVDTTASAATNPIILKLSNGNIVSAFVLGGSIKYIVHDSYFTEVKALTSLVAVASSGFDMIALSAGGFAIVYHDNADNTKNKLVIFDNTGTITTAAVDVWTRTGTTGDQFHTMVQLSNGNIAIAINSVNTVSSIGLYYSIFSILGVQVKAMDVLDAVSQATRPEISQLTGYFSIARVNGANQKAFVFNNAGTLQGAEFSAATTTGTGYNKTRLINNGTSFYLLWHRSSDSKFILTVLPITGTNYINSIISPSSAPYNLFIDAFCEEEVIVVAYGLSGATKCKFAVISIPSLALLNSSSTDYGDSATTTNSSNFIRIIPNGDRSFISVYDFTTTSPAADGLNISSGKYARTAISGIAKASGALNASIPIKTVAPFNEINTISGSPGKAFDHTSGALVGNKGTVTLSGAALKGF